MNNPGLVLGACAAVLGMAAAGGVHDCGADFATLEFRGLTSPRGFALVSGMRECRRLHVPPSGIRSVTRRGSQPAIPPVILTL
jgi:hypothetical protein